MRTKLSAPGLAAAAPELLSVLSFRVFIAALASSVEKHRILPNCLHLPPSSPVQDALNRWCLTQLASISGKLVCLNLRLPVTWYPIPLVVYVPGRVWPATPCAVQTNHPTRYARFTDSGTAAIPNVSLPSRSSEACSRAKPCLASDAMPTVSFGDRSLLLIPSEASRVGSLLGNTSMPWHCRLDDRLNVLRSSALRSSGAYSRATVSWPAALTTVSLVSRLSEATSRADPCHADAFSPPGGLDARAINLRRDRRKPLAGR